MTIGYLYNLVYDKNVLFYQSGLNYSGSNIYRPGLISHYYAIIHNAQKGMDVYDFLAGDSDYKKSLSTNSCRMYWARLVKGKPRLYLGKLAAGRS
jgi:CelD/BcsL family acetyltransferase involved in cellulose biosynthesis